MDNPFDKVATKCDHISSLPSHNSPPSEKTARTIPCSTNNTQTSSANLHLKHQLDQQLESLSESDKTLINNSWSLFSNASSLQKNLIISGILLKCSTSQLSYVSHFLRPLLKVDFIIKLPKELSLKILSYLDAKSLVQASSVSKSWKQVANDDALWRTLCDQHINKKCTKCGWGLPLLLDDYLKRKRLEIQNFSQKRLKSSEADVVNSDPKDIDASFKVPSTVQTDNSFNPDTVSHDSCENSLILSKSFWKLIYRDRLSIERNWRKGKFVKKSILVHPSGVHCQQSNQELIITGTYSSSLNMYSVKTGKLIHVLEGHQSAIRDLYFDDLRLVTVSMDSTVRVWCYRQGRCKLVIPVPGAKCLHFAKDLLAVGMVNGSIHLWNFRNTMRHSLVGHRDTVTKVRIHKDVLLISSSDDGTVRLWDLKNLECIRIFKGHTSSVSCFQFCIPNNFPLEELRRCSSSPVPSSPTVRSSSPAIQSRCDEAVREGASLSTILSATMTNPTHSQLHRAPLLVTGSADNTLRVWSLQSGLCLRQSFGHLGEVTCLDMDTLRIVSGAIDGSIKVWDLDSGRCMHTLMGDSENPAPVLCASLADTRIVAGTSDGRLYMWDCSSDSHPACSLPALLSPAEPAEGWQHHFA